MRDGVSLNTDTPQLEIDTTLLLERHYVVSRLGCTFRYIQAQSKQTWSNTAILPRFQART